MGFITAIKASSPSALPRYLSGIAPMPMFLQPHILCSAIMASRSVCIRSKLEWVEQMPTPYFSAISRSRSGSMGPKPETCAET